LEKHLGAKKKKRKEVSGKCPSIDTQSDKKGYQELLKETKGGKRLNQKFVSYSELEKHRIA